jgi:hypothetical protein
MKKLIKTANLIFLTEKSVLSDSLPKTAFASHEKPLVFDKVKRQSF